MIAKYGSILGYFLIPLLLWGIIVLVIVPCAVFFYEPEYAMQAFLGGIAFIAFHFGFYFAMAAIP